MKASESFVSMLLEGQFVQSEDKSSLLDPEGNEVATLVTVVDENHYYMPIEDEMSDCVKVCVEWAYNANGKIRGCIEWGCE